MRVTLRKGVARNGKGFCGSCIYMQYLHYRLCYNDLRRIIIYNIVLARRFWGNLFYNAAAKLHKVIYIGRTRGKIIVDFPKVHYRYFCVLVIPFVCPAEFIERNGKPVVFPKMYLRNGVRVFPNFKQYFPKVFLPIKCFVDLYCCQIGSIQRIRVSSLVTYIKRVITIIQVNRRYAVFCKVNIGVYDCAFDKR